MKIRFASTIGIAIVVLGVAAPAFAGRDVPIRMSGYTVGSDSPDLACRGFRGSATGTLSGAPFGKARWTNSQCGDALAEPGFITMSHGRFTLGGRTGTISGRLTGRGSPPSAKARFFASGEFTITGGTGLWKGATGGGLWTSEGGWVSGPQLLKISGTLTPRR